MLRTLPATESVAADSDTALGDWYVKRLVVDRAPLLLLVSSRALLSIAIPARRVRQLPGRLVELVGSRLKRLGIPPRIIGAEQAAMQPVLIARTQDRSILGILVDFAKMIPSYLPAGSWDETTLPLVEDRLAENPCFASGPSDKVIFPEKVAPALLRARWHAV